MVGSWAALIHISRLELSNERASTDCVVVTLQVVAFQATMQMMAENFPGAFAGYSLNVRESHQRTKVDTSGTAKEIVTCFEKLGIPFKPVRPKCPCKWSARLRHDNTILWGVESQKGLSAA